jgi:two-component system, OmpR family, phosphate regulon response regulator PhoB
LRDGLGNTLNSHKSRVLLVHHESAFVWTLRSSLETHGFLVDHVTHGHKALNRIPETQPHIVLLNWTLPDVSGIELCRQLRAQTETKDLRVILVGDHAGDRNVIQGLMPGRITTWSNYSALPSW